MYQIHLSQKAQEFLDKLDKHLRERIENRLKRLINNPVPSDAKFIIRDELGDKLFRYRIGKTKERLIVKYINTKILVNIYQKKGI